MNELEKKRLEEWVKANSSSTYTQPSQQSLNAPVNQNGMLRERWGDKKLNNNNASNYMYEVQVTREYVYEEDALERRDRKLQEMYKKQQMNEVVVNTTTQNAGMSLNEPLYYLSENYYKDLWHSLVNNIQHVSGSFPVMENLSVNLKLHERTPSVVTDLSDAEVKSMMGSFGNYKTWGSYQSMVNFQETVKQEYIRESKEEIKNWL